MFDLSDVRLDVFLMKAGRDKQTDRIVISLLFIGGSRTTQHLSSLSSSSSSPVSISSNLAHRDLSGKKKSLSCERKEGAKTDAYL